MQEKGLVYLALKFFRRFYIDNYSTGGKVLGDVTNTCLQRDCFIISCCYFIEKYDGGKANPDALFKIRKTGWSFEVFRIWPHRRDGEKCSNTVNYT